MNLEIIHSNVRQIAYPHPMPTGIERSEKAEMGAGIEQILIHRILAHHFHGIVRRKSLSDHVLPGLSQVGGAQNKRAIIAARDRRW